MFFQELIKVLSEKKKKCQQRLLEALDAEQIVLERSVQNAGEGATHPDSKPENKYDTRGLESSYLAGAQQARLEDLLSLKSFVKSIPLNSFSDQDSIIVNALVSVLMDDQPKAYWILSHGGGYALNIDSETITTISSKTPLAGQLIAKCRGDVFEFKLLDHWREFTIVDFE